MPLVTMKAHHLLNIAANDGSRQFGELPETVSFDRLRSHLETLPDTRVTDFLTDHITEVWIDFSFRGHHFTVNNQYGDYCFFVQETQAPDEILEAVLTHCRSLLGEERKPAAHDGAA